MFVLVSVLVPPPYAYYGYAYYGYAYYGYAYYGYAYYGNLYLLWQSMLTMAIYTYYGNLYLLWRASSGGDSPASSSPPTATVFVSSRMCACES